MEHIITCKKINEDFFKFLKEENFIVSKIDNKIGIEMIIPQGFKKVNLHFDLNLIKNKIEDDFLNLLNNFNEFKKYTTEKINMLEKANSEKDIIIENLSNEIKNLKRMHLISDNKPINCIKTFKYPKKIIYCLKVDAQIDISNYIDYNKKFGCDWFKPDSSEEVNDIIEHFYDKYELYDIKKLCWIITYGVETNPKEKKVGGFLTLVQGEGYYGGDDNIPGRCNGSGFTAFRKYPKSFANPNHFKKLCNWNSDHKYSIICLQKKYN